MAIWNVDSALVAGLDALGIEVDAEAREKLLAYVDLLVRWNRAYNLTAVNRPEAMVARHLLDSLSILPWLRGPVVLDAGSGAGLPGIPLAVVRPSLRFYLADSNGKRIRFLNHVVRTLQLDNVWTEHGRLEQLSPDRAVDDITARALAPLPRMVEWLSALLQRDGTRLLAMKGTLEDDELDGLTGYTTEVIELAVPGEHGVRQLVVVQKT